eukprot:9032824-Heterocapsa_arctica.AAC.1
MCAYGLKDPVTGLPHKKTTKLASNNAAVIEHLCGRCERTQPHQRLEGSTKAGRRTSLAGRYTEKFCQAIVGAIESSVMFVATDEQKIEE